MTISETQCPVCSSTRISSAEKEASFAVQLGPSVAYKEVVDTCLDCATTGDFDGRNAERIEAARKASEEAFIRAALDELAAAGISNASFERAFSLPQRTTARWKLGSASAGAGALLRCVKTYPWLVDVAEHRFARPYSTYALCREFGRHIANTWIAHAAPVSGPVFVASIAPEQTLAIAEFSGAVFEPRFVGQSFRIESKQTLLSGEVSDEAR